MTAREGITRRASEWVYRGVWGVLTGLLDVPRHPPDLPLREGETLDQRRPSEEWLRYRKFWFWLACLTFDIGLAGAWIAIYFASELVAMILLAPWLFVMIVPDIIAYVAIHLRYDTTWYVFSPRSMRLRRGIWIINEMTITYENIQDVQISQGPIQRHFGFADLMVKTAGGGASAGNSLSTHIGLIQGINDAAQLRDAIMDRVRASKSAGLGDEHPPMPVPSSHSTAAFTREHIDLLRDIATVARKISA